MTTGSTGSVFSKWQLAVLIGAPVAIGLTYLYLRKEDPKFQDADGKKKKLRDLKDLTISLDGEPDKTDSTKSSASAVVPPPKRPAPTPLQQALDFKNLGNDAFKRGKYDEAIEHYTQAIATCPTSSVVDLGTFYQNRAAAYEQLQKWSSVRDDCSLALEHNSRYVKALMRRARANECLNEFFASLEDVTAACILESFQNNSTLTFADRILKHIGKLDAAEALRTRVPVIPSTSFIKTYFSSFSHDPIRDVTAVSSKPTGFLRAKSALDSERYEEIIPACTEEIDRSDSSSEYKDEAFLLRGTFYMLTGQMMEAVIDFNAVIDNTKATAKARSNAYIKKASLMVQSQNAEGGLTNFAEAEKIDPTNPDIYHQRGQVFILLEQISSAVDEFTKAVRLDPNMAMTYVQKCYSEYRLAFLQQNQAALIVAMSSFKDAMDRFPKCFECFSVMAQVLTEQQQFQQADEFYAKAIVLSPETATIHVHRGIMQLQWNGDVELAIEYINRAIELDEKCEFALETLGTIEVQRGNLETAKELFMRAIRLAKSEAELQHLYALKNAAAAQINVAKKLGLDLSSLSALAAAGMA